MREITAQELEAKRVNLGDALDEPGMTLTELWQFATFNSIPATARVVYAGCTTHAIALDWTED